MRAGLGFLILLVLIAIGLLLGRDYVRRHPQDVPWTALDLDDPVGAFTGTKLAALRGEPARCVALLRDSGSRDAVTPPLRATPDCAVDDGMRLARGGARTIAFAPAGLVTSCPVAASLLLLERRVVQPAAHRHLGATVATIDHVGSYSCRRLYGGEDGPFSEHATADAVDITGFRLSDGRRVSLLRDWESGGPEAAFLKEVRDGACRLFATVLSPDYNAAHKDHFHLDQAERGTVGWSMCR